MSARPLPPIRAEYVVPLGAPAAALWEALARRQDNDLLLPGALQTARAFAAGMVSGELPGYVAASLAVLVQGYALGTPP
ncbi:hypothetical protein [Massilia mucilaginosa]|uniref:hypothetical protein n=1 Tax=Massilia mucilaginosa TaxID=2609282 RepID=UPI001651ED54